jgi:hypothetical protein
LSGQLLLYFYIANKRKVGRCGGARESGDRRKTDADFLLFYFFSKGSKYLSGIFRLIFEHIENFLAESENESGLMKFYIVIFS